jgi:hypothetical protein
VSAEDRAHPTAPEQLLDAVAPYHRVPVQHRCPRYPGGVGYSTPLVG